MNDVRFIKGNGGLGKTLSDADGIAGIVIYDAKFLNNAGFIANGLTVFTEAKRIIKFNRLTDVEAVGITSTNSLMKEYWYQISEFFRTAGNVDLYIGLYNDTAKLGTPIALTFTEVNLVQTFAAGEIRQIGVYNTKNTFAYGDVELLQGVANTLATNNMPLSIVYGSNIKATADVTTLHDLRNLSTVAPNVSVVILQDGANVGAALYVSEGNSIPALGVALGTIASSKVNESIAWVEKFNLAFGGELDVIAFGNGQLYSALTPLQLSDVNDLGYLFGVKHIGIAGTYFNDNHTSDTIISDYAYISEVRTIDKAIRKVRIAILPKLNSPLKIKTDGTVDPSTILFLEGLCAKPLSVMEANGEISASNVYINPNQSILTTSKLVVAIVIIPTGTARNIEINIAFTTSL